MREGSSRSAGLAAARHGGLARSGHRRRTVPKEQPSSGTEGGTCARRRRDKPRLARASTDLVLGSARSAPQHPASHVLHSIPPRAPSRSSRSNILSYTIHLATSSRLSSYSSASGSRQLLHLAELERDTQDGIDIDEAWFEAEQKTQGLWKLGANLLQSSRREGGVLPPAVERRVHLAGLAEDVLLSPAAERAVTKIDADSVQPSAEVDELVALKPLTAPDSSTHYHSSVAAAGDDPSGRPRVNSVAQSLIDLKFGVKAEPSSSSSAALLDDDDKPLYDAPESFAGVPSSSTSTSTGAAGPSTTPHMDYRIVLSQSMRTRARSIFAHSPLPSLPASYCRRHRVRSCAVCAALVAAASERESNHGAMRRLNVPGAGLRGRGADGEAKKPLVGLVPAFLKLSAALLEDVKERAGGPASGGGAAAATDGLFAAAAHAGAASKGKGRAGAGDEDEDEPRRHDLHVTAEWFDLLTALLVQACLEGYLVDGWTGTEGVETLFGVGCGVWEGRGWSAPTPAVVAAPPASTSAATSRRASVQHHVEDDGDWSESDEDDDEGETDDEAERVRVREEETRALVCAAKLLFGSRDVAQADYERGMRDRTHEVRRSLPSQARLSFVEQETLTLSLFRARSSSTSRRARTCTSTSTRSTPSTRCRSSRTPSSTLSRRPCGCSASRLWQRCFGTLSLAVPLPLPTRARR